MTYNHEIRLDYNGTLFALMQELEVRVDGVTYIPPVYHPSGVTVLSTGLYIVSRVMANTGDFCYSGLQVISSTTVHGGLFACIAWSPLAVTL